MKLSQFFLIIGFLLPSWVKAENPEQPSTIRVYVSGAIQKAGGYDVPESMAFIAAILAAGGPGDFADLKQIKILRPSAPENNKVSTKSIATVDYTLIIDGKAAVPEIKNGDIISIPERTRDDSTLKIN